MAWMARMALATDPAATGTPHHRRRFHSSAGIRTSCSRIGSSMTGTNGVRIRTQGGWGGAGMVSTNDPLTTGLTAVSLTVAALAQPVRTAMATGFDSHPPGALALALATRFRNCSNHQLSLLLQPPAVKFAPVTITAAGSEPDSTAATRHPSITAYHESPMMTISVFVSRRQESGSSFFFPGEGRAAVFPGLRTSGRVSPSMAEGLGPVVP
ncbi:uncharacterized protein BP01DRAFT_3946 [Aspergillus saccharolyticus JOP 1030-1]|uniref:Uncharacterized protein n=1 Tax=Aspergillus saccharolyticus JOP 1030-1 TaxID=1450539 RepID=A0A318ZQ22_9EURO|nr:hypothetical protein BP01DRAFT_3946 [Aspergillus saccharolyticus JOP 1030-1]PYH49721.1 hypothetical protein BP01DRAFT_3946 [Aspergillus saccharolyticus JOP 1030-1]